MPEIFLTGTSLDLEDDIMIEQEKNSKKEQSQIKPMIEISYRFVFNKILYSDENLDWVWMKIPMKYKGAIYGTPIFATEIPLKNSDENVRVSVGITDLRGVFSTF